MGEQILRNFMEVIKKKHNLIDYTDEIVPILSTGSNYTSNLYSVTFTKGDESIHMFAKVAAVGDKMRSQSPKFYEIEEFAYTKLARVYETLQEDHNVPEEHRLSFAKCYGCKPDLYEETIVLENLLEIGYQSYDRFTTFDWEYAKSAVGELAKMHSLSFAYGVYYPKEFNKIIDEYKFNWDPTNEQLLSHINTMVNRALAVVTKEENKEKLRRFYQPFDMKGFGDVYKWSGKPVLGHGDYRPSNLMHRIRKDGSVDIKIVDLQSLQCTNPLVDLLYFIYTGSDEEFRAKYYEKLLDHYYTELEASMKRFHIDPEQIYSRNQFYKEFKERHSFGLTMAVFLLPIITADIEDIPKVCQDLDITDFLMKTSALFAERLNGVINDYIRFGVLK